MMFGLRLDVRNRVCLLRNADRERTVSVLLGDLRVGSFIHRDGAVDQLRRLRQRPCRRHCSVPFLSPLRG